MSNLEIFESSAYFNKWLKELTKYEIETLMEMLDEARYEGFKNGALEAQYDAAHEIQKNYVPYR